MSKWTKNVLDRQISIFGNTEMSFVQALTSSTPFGTMPAHQLQPYAGGSSPDPHSPWLKVNKETLRVRYAKLDAPKKARTKEKVTSPYAPNAPLFPQQKFEPQTPLCTPWAEVGQQPLLSSCQLGCETPLQCVYGCTICLPTCPNHDALSSVQSLMMTQTVIKNATINSFVDKLVCGLHLCLVRTGHAPPPVPGTMPASDQAIHVGGEGALDCDIYIAYTPDMESVQHPLLLKHWPRMDYTRVITPDNYATITTQQRVEEMVLYLEHFVCAIGTNVQKGRVISYMMFYSPLCYVLFYMAFSRANSRLAPLLSRDVCCVMQQDIVSFVNRDLMETREMFVSNAMWTTTSFRFVQLYALTQVLPVSRMVHTSTSADISLAVCARARGWNTLINILLATYLLVQFGPQVMMRYVTALAFQKNSEYEYEKATLISQFHKMGISSEDCALLFTMHCEGYMASCAMVDKQREFYGDCEIPLSIFFLQSCNLQKPAWSIYMRYLLRYLTSKLDDYLKFKNYNAEITEERERYFSALLAGEEQAYTSLQQFCHPYDTFFADFYADEKESYVCETNVIWNRAIESTVQRHNSIFGKDYYVRRCMQTLLTVLQDNQYFFIALIDSGMFCTGALPSK